MKVAGLITEYNPFHLGHKYHLEKTKETAKATHTIAVMSSSFVQRGEPALVDKWTRAKMAVDNGVDLVLELPFVFSVQTAELFALGALKILDAINVVDCISFGSEIGEIEPLYKAAQILNEEPEEFKIILKNRLSLGMPYSASRGYALQNYIEKMEKDSNLSYEALLKESNNILGIEYIKALIKLKSNIVPHTIKRFGDKYNDQKIQSQIASATGIRNILFENQHEKAKSYMPEISYSYLMEFYEKYKMFNSIEEYRDIYQYLFRTKSREELKKLMDMENGLENRILEKGLKFYELERIIEEIRTKRYAATRIKRILIHLLLDLKREEIEALYALPTEHIRVLGLNKKGMEILNKIKTQTELSIITKFSDYKNLLNENINKFMDFEEKATDIYYLAFNKDYPYKKMDYITTPYINFK